MKKVMLFYFSALILLLTGCTQQADVNAILDNTETRKEIFSGIIEDHALMTEFINAMMSNEHAMMMMKGNQDMMGMMNEKTEMTHSMMSDMIKDGKMMGHMMQMMKQEGMMSEECMQSCMKMMKDKGMSMDMGMMGDVE